MRIDLHTHSNASDGTEDPADVVRSAVAGQLDVLALTDHDTTAGWADALTAARQLRIGFVPGMEVSCQTAEGISVHVLSYLHDPTDDGLLTELGRSRQSRLTRAERMVDRLATDFPITWEEVEAHVAPGATVGRPHIADALVTAGVVSDRTEAFNRMLHSRSPYFIRHYAPRPADAVRLIRAAGGVPVFAHPVASARGRVVSDDVIRSMVVAGLMGLEVFHRDNPAPGREHLLGIAEEHGLIITGSSDYHGTGKPNRLGENTTSEESLERILAAGSGSAAYLPR